MSRTVSKEKEEKSVAILLANLKKAKTANWLEIARACRTLLQRPNWGIHRMSEFFGVSEYLLRQIDKINDLTDEVKELVRDGELGLEESYLLWRRGKEKQAQVAKAASGLTAHELRQFVQLLMKNESMSMAEARRLTEATRTKEVRIVMLPLNSETYEMLDRLSKRRRHMNIHETALKILEDYLNEHK